MAIVVKINTVDRSSFVLKESLIVSEELNEKQDKCSFSIRKNATVTPAYGDDIQVFDGSTQIFGGTILKVKETTDSGADTLIYNVQAVDYIYELDKLWASKTYETETIKAIITDLLSSYATDFNADNVDSVFNVEKIVFNQVPLSVCIKRLAELINYFWYVDENKSIHFFDKTGKIVSEDLTDTSGNYVYKSLKRNVDGSQITNRVKVRGGEYNGTSYTDVITVSGDDTKSFKLPYKMANLAIRLDTGAGWVSKTVGTDFIDDFTSKDVLHNFQDRSFRFETALADGDKIEFSGNPKIRVFAIAEDSVSVLEFGVIEKMLRINSISDNDTARRRATAELYAYAQEYVDAEFMTNDAGLRTGMRINLTSTVRSSDDDFIISSIQFKAITPTEFVYKVKCITSKRFDFITKLQEIFEPDPLDIDEVEVSESIFAENAIMTIAEEHEVVSPVEDFASVTFAETILIDPFGAGTDATYVLAPYTPSLYPSEITKNPDTMADDDTVGTNVWNNPDNAKVSDNAYATATLNSPASKLENSIKIVKGGSITGDEKSIGATIGSESYMPYGSSSDLWGETWTPADINNSNFGVVTSYKQYNIPDTGEWTISHYLKATNFGFSIPADAIINGILVEVEAKGNVFLNANIFVDHIRITVYYTTSSQTDPKRAGRLDISMVVY